MRSMRTSSAFEPRDAQRSTYSSSQYQRPRSPHDSRTFDTPWANSTHSSSQSLDDDREKRSGEHTHAEPIAAARHRGSSVTVERTNTIRSTGTSHCADAFPRADARLQGSGTPSSHVPGAERVPKGFIDTPWLARSHE